MRNNNIAKRYKTRFIIDLIIAAFLTCIIEGLLMTFTGRLYFVFRLPGRENSLAFLLVISAVIIYALIFFFLRRSYVRQIEKLSKTMKELADGDLGVRLEVLGDDEFSEMAEDLNDLASRLEELLEFEREAEKSKNDLITNIAHDLKTPLTSVIGYLELLSGKNGAKLSDEQRRKYLSIAYTKSRRLEELINDLFDYTKLSYGKITMNVGYVDIVKLLEQLLEEAYPNFAEKQLSYSLSSNVPALEIAADSGLLARLFDNLISNAIKYGAEGKRVTVRINADHAADIVEVQVINYGFVIDEKDLPFIFDKFYRADKARSTQTGGTGLGLAIARDIARMHGGSIGVNSDLDGTVFTVRLKIHFDKNKENLKRA